MGRDYPQQQEQLQHLLDEVMNASGEIDSQNVREKLVEILAQLPVERIVQITLFTPCSCQSPISSPSEEDLDWGKLTGKRREGVERKRARLWRDLEQEMGIADRDELFGRLINVCLFLTFSGSDMVGVFDNVDVDDVRDTLNTLIDRKETFHFGFHNAVDEILRVIVGLISSHQDQGELQDVLTKVYNRYIALCQAAGVEPQMRPAIVEDLVLYLKMREIEFLSLGHLISMAETYDNIPIEWKTIPKEALHRRRCREHTL